MDKRAVTLAGEVCQFLMDRSRQPNAYDGYMPVDDFAYGSALAKWERNGKPKRAWFSTEDKHLLHYKEALTLRFGLPVVTREEGLRREAEQPTIRETVTETTWLDDLGIINPFEDDNA